MNQSSINVATPISKTAIDALNAKASAVQIGYNPISKEHDGELYKKILLDHNIRTMTTQTQQQKTKKNNSNGGIIKRQSPLVNAGYAIRVAALSKMIHEFITITCYTQRQRQRQCDEVNLVLLGCGLDVLGLWAAASSSRTRNKVNLYEMDCIENCLLKKQILLATGFIMKEEEEEEEERTKLKNDSCSSLCSTQEDHDVLSIHACNAEDTHMNNDNNDVEGYYDDSEQESLHPCILQGKINRNYYHTTTQEERIKDENENYNKQSNENENENDLSNYTLMCADLRCIRSVKNAFQASSINNEVPTIVISELVIAYLCTDNVRELLFYLSTDICKHERSMLIAYEPVFPSPPLLSKTKPNKHYNSSLVDGYASNYFGQFEYKLNRGSNHNNKSNNKNSKGNTLQTSSKSKKTMNPFQPIGNSNAEVIHTLRSCCFDGLVDCKSMADAAKSSWNFDHIRMSPELFDEYAALRLHLECYCVIAATSTMGCMSSYNNHSWLTRFQRICPWSNIDHASLGMGRLFKERIMCKGVDKDLVLCSIKKEHQEQVRNLFTSMYSHLFDEYPSVKKMVKSAIKIDLSAKELNSNAQNSTCNDDECAIWKYYSDKRGAFWVVLDQSFGCDKVVGCIGIIANMLSNDSAQELSGLRSYEIKRLAVAKELRGKGAGTLLLQKAEEFITNKEIRGKAELIATTPEILQAANSLYSSCSYSKIDEVMMGNMIINTYKKVLK